MKMQTRVLSNFIFILLSMTINVYPSFAIEVESVKESCVDYAYSKGLKYYNESNWLEAYAYLKAAQVCFNYTNFKMSSEGELDTVWTELQEAMNFAYSAMQPKQGASLTFIQKPPLRDISQMPR